MVKPLISIIICTLDNAESLKGTLASFREMEFPADLAIELIVVDNGTDKTTAEVVAGQHAEFPIRLVVEPRKGLSNARNAGIRASQGVVILFTDDDVIPRRDWIETMARPLVERKCDGISGRVKLSDDLVKSWMSPMHRSWLAAADELNHELIGACMGFHRSVLEKIPSFDPELGAGALGFAEETLFSNQMLAAGFRLDLIQEECVVHCPDPSRLTRSQWLSSAERRGKSMAYLHHHWEHGSYSVPRLQSIFYRIKLWLRSIFHGTRDPGGEGCESWELAYLTQAEKFSHFAKECRRPRKYEKHGLVKLAC